MSKDRSIKISTPLFKIIRFIVFIITLVFVYLIIQYIRDPHSIQLNWGPTIQTSTLTSEQEIDNCYIEAETKYSMLNYMKQICESRGYDMEVVSSITEGITFTFPGCGYGDEEEAQRLNLLMREKELCIMRYKE